MSYIEKARQNAINAEKAQKLDALENRRYNEQEAMSIAAAEIDKVMQQQAMNAPRSLSEAYLMDMQRRATPTSSGLAMRSMSAPVSEAEFTSIPSRTNTLNPSLSTEEMEAQAIINSL